MDDVGTTVAPLATFGLAKNNLLIVKSAGHTKKKWRPTLQPTRIQGEFDLELLAEANQLLEDQAPDMLEMTGQTETERNHLKRRFGPDPEDDQNQEPKNDDGSRPFEVRLSEPQLSVVENAIATMKRTRQLTMEANSDLNGNALPFYICEQYLQSEPVPTR